MGREADPRDVEVWPRSPFLSLLAAEPGWAEGSVSRALVHRSPTSKDGADDEVQALGDSPPVPFLPMSSGHASVSTRLLLCPMPPSAPQALLWVLLSLTSL